MLPSAGRKLSPLSSLSRSFPFQIMVVQGQSDYQVGTGGGGKVDFFTTIIISNKIYYYDIHIIYLYITYESL